MRGRTPTCIRLESLEPRVLLSTLDPGNPIAEIRTDYGVIEVELYIRGSSSSATEAAQAFMNDVFDGRLDHAACNEDQGRLQLLSSSVVFEIDPEGLLRDLSGMPGLGPEPGAFGCIVGPGLDVVAEILDVLTAPSSPFMPPVSVHLIDIEVVKPEDGASYTTILAYPEGYRSDTITETIQLANANSAGVDYQVIARYENGVRDQVLSFGTLDAGSVRAISLSDPMLSLPPTSPLVPNAARLPFMDRPYALEIQATGTIGASFHHTDFGAEIGEDFFGYRQAGSTVIDSRFLDHWSLGGIGSSAANPEHTYLPFLLYYNPTSQTTTVTINFYRARTPMNPALTVTRELGPYRRGGLELFSFPQLDDAVVFIDLFSTGHILAAISVYEQNTSPGPTPVLAAGAHGSMLTVGIALNGVLPGVQLGGPGENYFSFMDPDPQFTVQLLPFMSVQYTTTAGDMGPFPNGDRGIWRRVELDPGRQSLGLPIGEFVTLNFQGSFNLHGYHVATTANSSGSTVGDTIGTPFKNYLSGGHLFSGGRLDLANPSERDVLSLYNPQFGVDVDVSVRVLFSDGTSANAASLSLSWRERADLDLGTLDAIRDKLTASPGVTYAIEVLSSATGATPNPPSIAAQFTHLNNSQPAAYTSGGTLFNPPAGTGGVQYGPVARYFL